MRRFENFLNNENLNKFSTYLPIQLDGTCNGFQHLAMLSNESKLFESLNLYSSTKKNDPFDFYQVIVDQINLNIEMRLKDNTSDKIEGIERKESYIRLVNLGITRKIVKPAIMNKPYNATQRTLVKYIKDLLYYARSDSVTTKNKDGELITFIRG
jgi:DNA-directed RNA polymerase